MSCASALKSSLAKTITMNKNCIPVAVLVAGAVFALSTPLRAQIATSVDENGKLVFVNGDSPKPLVGVLSVLPRASARASSAFLRQAAAETLGAKDGRLDRIVRDAAARHQVDPALVKAVISTESGWNPQAVSRKGAVGLMQLIPGTAQRFGVGNPFDPAQNVEGGTTYLKVAARSLQRRPEQDARGLQCRRARRRSPAEAFRHTGKRKGTCRRCTDAYFRPGSGRDSTLWTPPRNPVRKEVDANGRVIFTNE